jgi:hypothetical protein
MNIPKHAINNKIHGKDNVKWTIKDKIYNNHII